MAYYQPQESDFYGSIAEYETDFSSEGRDITGTDEAIGENLVFSNIAATMKQSSQKFAQVDSMPAHEASEQWENLLQEALVIIQA